MHANTLRARLLAACAGFLVSMWAASGLAAVATRVPVSAGLATGIAADLFPVSLKLAEGTLFLTNPVVLFLENGRVAVSLRFQAFDHRPAEGIAISEMGQATFSGVPGYDSDARKVLLLEPKIDSLAFDRGNDATQAFLQQIHAAWSAQVTNPVRVEMPSHPYLLPLRNNIQDITYDGRNILLTLSY